MYEIFDELVKENNTAINDYTAKIADYEGRIITLVNLAEKVPESETLMSRLKALEQEKRAFEKRLDEEYSNIIILENEQIVYFLQRFLSGDREDPFFKQTVIELLVNSVTVWDEPDGYYKITTLYNITEDKQRTVHVNKHGELFGCVSSRVTKGIIPELFFHKRTFGIVKMHKRG